MSHSCSSVASDGSFGSVSGASSSKQHTVFQANRKYSTQLSGNISIHQKSRRASGSSRRASVSPTFNLSSSNDAIDEENVDLSNKAQDQPRKKPNTAQRIEMIRRTLRRQSTSSAPIQPPKHSIMAGFAGFLNMTTATCNTGVPMERRMSIPVVVQDDDSKGSESPRTILPYSYLPPMDLSPIYQEEDSNFSHPSLPSTGSVKGNIGKLQTRWSDSNVVVGNRRILKSNKASVNSSNPAKMEVITAKPHNNDSDGQSVEGMKVSTNSSIGDNKNSDNIANTCKRNRIRSDSLACPDALMKYGGINRVRNNSDPYVIIRVTGKKNCSNRHLNIP